MDQGVHFISGLPRSGSTLLAAILRQNPRFHAAMSSPLGGLYTTLEQAMSRRNEAATFLEEAHKRRLLAGLFDSYYQPVHAQQVVFDTHRLWCTKLDALTQLFPKAKWICCVRPIPWIMDSVESLIRKNAFEVSGLFDAKTGATVYTRVHRLAASDGMVGFALDALREACFSQHASRLLLIEYEALVREPKRTLDALYAFVGERPFAHDFADVAYEADAFDMALGTPGLHRVRGRVEWRPRPSVLPPDLFARFENDAFWRQPQAPGFAPTLIRPPAP